jgi:hypothetical protein
MKGPGGIQERNSQLIGLAYIWHLSLMPSLSNRFKAGSQTCLALT